MGNIFSRQRRHKKKASSQSSSETPKPHYYSSEFPDFDQVNEPQKKTRACHTDPPQESWTNDQCCEWIQDVLVQRCEGWYADDAEKIAWKIMARKSDAGPKLFEMKREDWMDRLGDVEAGKIIFALIFTTRIKGKHLLGRINGGEIPTQTDSLMRYLDAKTPYQ